MNAKIAECDVKIQELEEKHLAPMKDSIPENPAKFALVAKAAALTLRAQLIKTAHASLQILAASKVDESLINGFKETIKGYEERAQAVTDVAAGLNARAKESLNQNAVVQSAAMDALRAAAAAKKDVVKYATSIATKGQITADKFAATLKKLKVEGTDAQFQSVFEHFDAEKTGSVAAEDFAKMLRVLYKATKEVAMQNSVAIAKSKILGKLAAGDIVEKLEEPVMDEKSKSDRLKVRSLSSDMEGYVTLKGSAGTVFLVALTAEELRNFDEGGAMEVDA